MSSWNSPSASHDDAGAPVTVTDLIAALGHDNVQLLNPQTTGHPVVTGTEFADTSAPLGTDPGMLFYIASAHSLGFSVGGGLDNMLQRAAAANASAVGLKAPPQDIPTLAMLGERAGVPILLLADSIPWRYLDAMISGALGERDWQGRPMGHGSGSLHDLVNSLASHFGGAVSIEDLGRAIVAYSTHPGQLIDPLRTEGILSRQATDSPHNNARYREVLRADGPLCFPGDGNQLPRTAIAVRSGTINLGSIWVIRTNDSPLDDEDHRALSAAAVSAAGLIMESTRRSTESNRTRSEAIRKLLSTEALSSAELDELRIQPGTPLRLLAFEVLSAAVPPLIIDQIRALLSRTFTAMLGATTIITAGHRFYALCQPCDHQLPARLARMAVDQVHAAVGQNLSAALGSPVADIADFATARAEIDEILDAHLATEQEPVVSAESARPTLMLRAIERTLADTSWLRSEPIESLLEHDNRQGTDFARNVLAWLRANGNYAQAARDLNVHENTVRYRLRRAAEQFNLQLENPEQRLMAWTQLQVVALHKDL
ncbi:PucR family transcriptional regulator [Glutamicibacter endophyticus]|uniref:PucR family transcriptional regulator n=1 Tax=Glutamicibacter endophyticus TaxID=1522174 RepID=UPI003AF1A63C